MAIKIEKGSPPSSSSTSPCAYLRTAYHDCFNRKLGLSLDLFAAEVIDVDEIFTGEVIASDVETKSDVKEKNAAGSKLWSWDHHCPRVRTQFVEEDIPEMVKECLWKEFEEDILDSGSFFLDPDSWEEEPEFSFAAPSFSCLENPTNVSSAI
ncbi:hypothetical protein Ancab_023076 [Ancistrocladus abbreviatus]